MRVIVSLSGTGMIWSTSAGSLLKLAFGDYEIYRAGGDEFDASSAETDTCFLRDCQVSPGSPLFLYFNQTLDVFPWKIAFWI